MKYVKNGNSITSSCTHFTLSLIHSCPSFQCYVKDVSPELERFSFPVLLCTLPAVTTPVCLACSPFITVLPHVFTNLPSLFSISLHCHLSLYGLPSFSIFISHSPKLLALKFHCSKLLWFCILAPFVTVDAQVTRIWKLLLSPLKCPAD